MEADDDARNGYGDGGAVRQTGDDLTLCQYSIRSVFVN